MICWKRTFKWNMQEKSTKFLQHGVQWRVQNRCRNEHQNLDWKRMQREHRNCVAWIAPTPTSNVWNVDESLNVSSNQARHPHIHTHTHNHEEHDQHRSICNPCACCKRMPIPSSECCASMGTRFSVIFCSVLSFFCFSIHLALMWGVSIWSWCMFVVG